MAVSRKKSLSFGYFWAAGGIKERLRLGFRITGRPSKAHRRLPDDRLGGQAEPGPIRLYAWLTLSPALPAACLYHVFRRYVQQRWYWLMLFLPLAGCLLYLYDAFASRSQWHTLTHGMKGLFNRNYGMEELERAVRFTGNVTNKIRLADAYANNGRYPEAITLYQVCLQGFMAGDPDLRMKLLQVEFPARGLPGY